MPPFGKPSLDCGAWYSRSPANELDGFQAILVAKRRPVISLDWDYSDKLALHQHSSRGLEAKKEGLGTLILPKSLLHLITDL